MTAEKNRTPTDCFIVHERPVSTPTATAAGHDRRELLPFVGARSDRGGPANAATATMSASV